jgi:hypothetical protein
MYMRSAITNRPILLHVKQAGVQCIYLANCVLKHKLCAVYRLKLERFLKFFAVIFDLICTVGTVE